MYWMSAIMHTAVKNVREKPVEITVEIGEPKFSVSTLAVKKVEVARIAELNRIVRGRLLMLNVAAMPSRAETRIAAGPPYSSIVRKTNVSATVIRPLTRGMGIAMSELAITIRQRRPKLASIS